MKAKYLEFLCCPDCRGNLAIESECENNHRIQTGSLNCETCRKRYPIRNYVPRFVENQTYASSFGPQWKTFANSQLDTAEFHESEIRFRSEIGWDATQLKDKTVVELGSGAGRFVDYVSKQGVGIVVGLDITDAVDASQANLGDRENVFFVQGDIFQHPLKDEYFDFAYSIGVMHHTPDPQSAFNKMVSLVTDRGHVAVSLYEISLYHRPNRNTVKIAAICVLESLNLFRCELFRVVMTRIPHKLMIVYCKTVVPILHVLNKIPVLRYLRYFLPSTCYTHLPVICSMVDTMDTYSTKIVHQYRAKDIFQWFLQAGLENPVVMNSRAGWVSLNANVGDRTNREAHRRVLRQPTKPGMSGYIK